MSYNNIDENREELLNNIPIGILILNKDKNINNNYKITYCNELAIKLLSIPKDNDINIFIKNLNDYLEYSPFEKNNKTTLNDHIFLTKKSNNKIFIHNEHLMYIKVNKVKDKIYVLIDNYEDERKNIQQQFIQNIGYQYLLTLYHEINNPINSLLSILSEISGINNLNIKRIELLIFLIRLFLKNFILYFQIFSLTHIEKERNSTINLQNIFGRISNKFIKLFEYKKINKTQNLKILNGKSANYDYFLFKNLIKMIFVYFYQKSKIESEFSINIELLKNKENTIKIRFSNKNIEEEKLKYYSNEELINIEKINISEYNSNIQTLKITEKIIKKLINILKIESEYNFDSNDGNEIIIYIKINNEITFGSENDLEEFSENNEKHIEFMRKLSRSVTSKTSENTKNENDNNYISEFSFKSFCSFSKEDYSKDKVSNFKRSLKKNPSNFIHKTKSLNLRKNLNLSLFKGIFNNEFQKIKKNFEKEETNFIHHCKSFNNKNSINKIRNNLKEIETDNLNEIILEENDCYSSNLINEKKNKDLNLNKINIEEKENNKNKCLCKDVMIVDDEQFNLSCLSNNLKKINILCDSCNDGEECLNLIKKKIEKKCSCQKSNYKLILLDVVMPKINGIDTMKNIQKLVDDKKINNLNIIFISASVDKKIIFDLQKNFTVIKDFLTKPVKLSKIKDMVKRYYYDC